MSRRDWILAVVTASFLVAAGLRLSHAPESPTVVWPEIPQLSRSEPAPPAGEAAARAALAGNVFSARRSPPSVRFQIGAEPDAGETEASSPPPAPSTPRYRVAGIVLSGSEGWALIDVEPSTPGPEVYRQGDAVGAYRLEQVAYDHVLLVGAAGPVRIDVARPGEVARAAFPSRAPVPNAVATPESERPRAKSAANTPPGAIPPGW